MPAARISIDEFESMPEVPGKQELLAGEVITLPPTTVSQSRIIKALFRIFDSVFAAHRVNIRAGYRMSSYTWLRPDISVTRPEQPIADDYLLGSPMIAAEIISPDHNAEQTEAKIREYLNNGAGEVWVVYPRTRSMLVYQGSKVERVMDTYRSALVPVTISLNEILPAE